LALHPLALRGGRKRNYGVPGAAKNTGDFAWLFDMWIGCKRAAHALPSPYGREKEGN
jgi:hypothetical protein